MVQVKVWRSSSAINYVQLIAILLSFTFHDSLSFFFLHGILSWATTDGK